MHSTYGVKNLHMMGWELRAHWPWFQHTALSKTSKAAKLRNVSKADADQDISGALNFQGIVEFIHMVDIIGAQNLFQHRRLIRLEPVD
jgi:hypothetical protein